MNGWRTMAAVASAGFLMAGAAFASVTIRNVAPRPHGVEPGASLEVIERAIVQAAAERQWYGAPESPGRVVVSTTIRTHRATVVIGYDATSFWIDYRDSANLDFNPKDLTRMEAGAAGRKQVIQKGPRIHPNYNLWVAELADHVAARARTIVATDSRPMPACEPTSIADELDKLDRLRQRGVLTQTEFDDQKRKLLGN